MIKALGYLLMIGGFCFGFYAAVWWAFVGGIMDIVYAVRAEELIKADLFIGLTKMFFSSIIGYASAAIFLIPGYAMIQDDD